LSASLRPSLVPSPTPVGLGQAVGRALSTAFEDMVFMEVSSLHEYAQPGVGVIWSRVATHAPVRAELMLQMTPSLVDACIDALYSGLDPNDAIRQDVVRELLNTISGLVMSNITETETIDLGLPESGVGLPSTVATDPELAQTQTSDLGGLAFTVHWR
jgi:Chemotaxis phosphatase CheX